MPNNLRDVIQGFVAGDDLSVIRTITNIPAGQTLVKGWLTVKGNISDADPGLVQKMITTSDVPGVGQITDDGAADGVGAVRFDLTGADTALLVPPSPNTPCYFDIQLLTSASKIYTPAKGTIAADDQVTRATS